MVDRSAHPLLRWLLPALAVYVIADTALTSVSGWGELKAAGYLYSAVIVSSGLLVALRGRSRPAERLPWLLIGLGLIAWGLGDVYYTAFQFDLDVVPVPSPADAGYLLLPPLVAAGLVGLLRSRGQAPDSARRVDAAIGALAIAAIGSALVMPTVRETLTSRGIEGATYLAYPLSDLMLLGVCVGALAGRGWLLDRTWTAMGLGVVCLWAADSSYVVLNAHGDYSPTSLCNAGWSAGAVLIAIGAWQPPGPVGAPRDHLRVLVMPIVMGMTALVTLAVLSVTQQWEPLSTLLAALALVAVFARLMLAFRETAEVLRGAQADAVTDVLTGLGNRRALTADLAEAVGSGETRVLALFDLDGFKGYNDTFGHPAGDALLARLGANLREVLGDQGLAYRMGGDEFCALVPAGDDRGQKLVAQARAALVERGEGFDVGCSYGSVVVPAEADAVADALRLADQRLYVDKRSDRASAGRQTRDVLLQALVERSPDLESHVHDVAVLAEATALRMGLGDASVEEVRRAAELHDVGKVAIPDAILGKRGPLDDDEWAFMRRHTLIGQRIVAAAPSLGDVGLLVRSSHERWDGGGYPDCLAGDAIPLGSRIIAVADAFDAMTVDRPYRAAVSVHAALAELTRCAGTQFDPEVVVHFRAAVVGLELPAAA